jgi:hypothetical protein
MSQSTKNKIFWSIFTLLIILSVGFTFLRVYVWKDYLITANTSCDPKIEASCFVVESEVVPTDENGIQATTTETTYYKIITIKAADVFACEQTAEKLNCGEELTCADAQENCTYEYCTEENVPEGESCSEEIGANQ